MINSPAAAYLYIMITAKFGGTAVTPRNLYRIKEILTDNHICAVVSAVGKENACDVKVTDLLRQAYFSLPDLSAFKKVEEKYRRLVLSGSIPVDVDRLLFDARKRLENCSNVQYAMSLGEELSAKTVAAYLGWDYIEAADTVMFSSSGLRYRDTLAKLRSAFKGVRHAVLAGFYGGYKQSRQTFSRGGSDITGALAANATDSELYENWTDVNGFFVADPHRVPGARTVRCMSYGDMRLLAQAGASVLHPDALYPAEEKGIAVNIRNFYNSADSGTLISHNAAQEKILGITEKFTDGLYITTAVFTVPEETAARCAADFIAEYTAAENIFGICLPARDVFGITSCTIAGKTLRIVSEKPVLRRLYDALPVD